MDCGAATLAPLMAAAIDSAKRCLKILGRIDGIFFMLSLVEPGTSNTVRISRTALCACERATKAKNFVCGDAIERCQWPSSHLVKPGLVTEKVPTSHTFAQRAALLASERGT